jgi:hypothetical protein
MPQRTIGSRRWVGRRADDPFEQLPTGERALLGGPRDQLVVSVVDGGADLRLDGLQLAEHDDLLGAHRDLRRCRGNCAASCALSRGRTRPQTQCEDGTYTRDRAAAHQVALPADGRPDDLFGGPSRRAAAVGADWHWRCGDIHPRRSRASAPCRDDGRPDPGDRNRLKNQCQGTVRPAPWGDNSSGTPRAARPTGLAPTRHRKPITDRGLTPGAGVK